MFTVKPLSTICLPSPQCINECWLHTGGLAFYPVGSGNTPIILAKCHACRSKTWISRLLTPVFRFVMPGGKVWAITALTDTFEKYINYLNKPEPKREKRSLCGWLSSRTFSEFSFFSREVSVPLCSHVRVQSSERLQTSSDIIGPYEKSWHSWDKKCYAYKRKKVGRYTLCTSVIHSGLIGLFGSRCPLTL